jgi:hypothetical protein
MFTLSVQSEGSNVKLLFSPNLCALCVSAVSPLEFFVSRLPVTPLFPFTLSAVCEGLHHNFSLTPLFPLHTGHSPVTPLFPAHTKNIGGYPLPFVGGPSRFGTICAPVIPTGETRASRGSQRRDRGNIAPKLPTSLQSQTPRLAVPKTNRRIALPHLTSCANISRFTPAFLQKMSGRRRGLAHV